MAKIFVLHVIVRLSVGGVEKWLLNVLKTYDRSRFQMDICCVGLHPDLGILADTARELGVNIYYVSLRNPLKFIGNLRNLLHKNHYHAVFNHIVPSLPTLFVARISNVPIRINMHHNSRLPLGALPPFLKILAPLSERISVWFSTQVLGCSITTLDSLFPTWRKNSKFIPLYYGIQIDQFQAAYNTADVRTELGIPIQGPIIGHAGRFALQKNHARFVEVAHILHQEIPNCHFLFIGEGPLQNRIEQLVLKLGLSGNVHFLGLRHDIPKLMAVMDIAFYPSIYEGSPITFIEAQVAGLPIVTGTRPEMQEAICPENARHSLINVDDPLLSATHLIQLLNDDALRRKIGYRGREWATQRFSIERSTICMEKILASAYQSI